MGGCADGDSSYFPLPAFFGLACAEVDDSAKQEPLGRVSNVEPRVLAQVGHVESKLSAMRQLFSYSTGNDHPG